MEKRTGEILFRDGRFLEKIKIGNTYSYWDEEYADITDEIRKAIIGEKPVDETCPYLPSVDYNFQKEENLYSMGLSGLSREQMEQIRKMVVCWRNKMTDIITDEKADEILAINNRTELERYKKV